MIEIKKINHNNLLYNSEYDLLTGEFYQHCLKLLTNFLELCDKPTNIILGNYPKMFNNSNRTFRITLQIEHIIVKNSFSSKPQQIFISPEKYNDVEYMVRIGNLEYLESFDFIFEYSLPNVYHIKTVEGIPRIDNLLQKIIPISPNMYDIDFIKRDRSEIITLFYAWTERRAKIYEDLKNKGITTLNINRCFSPECLLEIYKNTKILINVHQTDFHDTVEELRILPALRSGIIVIAEDSPLKEKIPYHEHIIWENLEKITDKVIEVNNNYDYFYEKIFGGDKLKNIFSLHIYIIFSHVQLVNIFKNMFSLVFILFFLHMYLVNILSLVMKII